MNPNYSCPVCGEPMAEHIGDNIIIHYDYPCSNCGHDPEPEELQMIPNPLYCANCDSESTHFIPDTLTPLCKICATAYEWGMGVDAPEHRILSPMEDYPNEA